MKNFKAIVLVSSLISIAPLVNAGRVSNAYHKVCDNLSNHKGKVCFVAGAAGATLATRIFSQEIDNYVKPLIKSVFKRTYNFFKRIFRSEK